MIPTTPALPAGGPGPAPLVAVDTARRAADVAPAAAPPVLGAQAVTQPEASRLPPLDAQSLTRSPVPVIPPDPPPVKGLGIPPLDTRVVGDFDEVETPPPPEATPTGMSDLLEALQDRAPPGLDRKA